MIIIETHKGLTPFTALSLLLLFYTFYVCPELILFIFLVNFILSYMAFFCPVTEEGRVNAPPLFEG